MSLQELESFGVAVARARSDALYAWREQHAKSIPLSDLLAEAVTSVTIEATCWPKGRLTIITHVRGRRQFDDETHVFRYNFAPQNGYRRMGSSLPSI